MKNIHITLTVFGTLPALNILDSDRSHFLLHSKYEPPFLIGASNFPLNKLFGWKQQSLTSPFHIEKPHYLHSADSPILCHWSLTQSKASPP